MPENKLEEIFGKKVEDKQQVPPLDPKIEEQKKIEAQKQKDQEHLANLKKAIAEADTILKTKRQQAKDPNYVPPAEELPEIDRKDPGAKAWMKEIKDSVDPLTKELEKEKQEIRSFAIKQFLQDKPNLVQNPEKLKQVIETYDRIKVATERTVEGVLIDLDKAYAAENHEELLTMANQRISSRAKAEERSSDIAVDRGSTSYPTQRDTNPKLPEDAVAQLAKWGMTEAQYWELKKKYPNK